MINEYFIDKSVCSLLSIEDNTTKTMEIFDSIDIIVSCFNIDDNENKFENNAISIDIQNKIDIIKNLVKTRKSSHNFDPIQYIDSISLGKFNHYKEYLETNLKEFSEFELDECYKYYITKKKLCNLLTNHNGFKNLLNDVTSGNFSDDYEIIERWEKQLSNSYNSLMEIKRSESIDTASILDLENDEYKPVLERLFNNATGNNVIRSGYNLLDTKAFMWGSFEKSRIYIIAGESGIGKSTMMVNIICNNIKDYNEDLMDYFDIDNKNMYNETFNGSNFDIFITKSTEMKNKFNKAIISYHKLPQETYVYITAENLLDETLIRFFSCLSGISYSVIINKLKEVPEFIMFMKNFIKICLKARNKNIKFFYVPSYFTTVRDIELIVDTCKKEHNVNAVFIDYLDLLRTSNSGKEMRFQLGEITNDLKKMSIDYDVSVITVTQLNRAGYSKDTVANLTNLSESSEKAHHADVIITLQNAKEEYLYYKTVEGINKLKLVRMSVAKNRCGPKDILCSLIMPVSVDDEDVYNFRLMDMPNIDKSDIIPIESINNLSEESNDDEYEEQKSKKSDTKNSKIW